MKIKRIAILTSGGDTPGMNTTIKRLVIEANRQNIDAFFVYNGFLGLYKNAISLATPDLIQGLNNQGGTIIYSTRFPDFYNEKIRKIAVKNLAKHEIDVLIVIGGDGSYRGANELKAMGVNVITLPGTIDNDINFTDYTIGFFTALETIVSAIDKIRQSSESHNRCAIIEIMGHHCGDLALYAGIATGSEIISIPEQKLSAKQIIAKINEDRKIHRQKRSIVILVTEYLYDDVRLLAKKIQNGTNIDTRVTVLGYQQRGGAPSGMDRFLGNVLAKFTINKVIANEFGLAIGFKDNHPIANEISDVIENKHQKHMSLIAEFYPNTKLD